MRSISIWLSVMGYGSGVRRIDTDVGAAVFLDADVCTQPDFHVTGKQRSMKSVRSYPSRLEADLARIALEAVGIPSIVVGIGVGMEGGAAGVQLLVPEDRVEAALEVLGDA
jgi:hypothetical protein